MGEGGDLVRYRVVVSGRVHGVWFRESCRREAVTAGVTGWVRNAADGSVEAALEGPAGAVTRVLDWIRVGPTQAVVAGVEVHAEPPVGETTFTVR